MKSVARALAVIRALNVPGRGRTLSEVSRDTDLPRAAARRFLLTLEDLGYVRSEDRRFLLTPRVLELGYAYLSSLSLPEIAQPHLRDLVGRVEESCSMSVLDAGDIVYVAREPTRRIMTVAISIGTRFPAYATSMGRVLLGGLPEPELRTLLAQAPPQPLTPHTLTDRDQLIKTIQEVRQRGWALVDQELEDGLRSIAAPVRDGRGAVLAAVNISAHASRTALDELRQRMLPELLRAVTDIEGDVAAGPRP
ncbi:MAG: helix-turn-helix domain-containing protein [Actinomycetota bacterium]|nr:helix-turn-helix domain-containing protein [Actinomycetota bacterium]